jgi:peptide/nickel transport system substrate-binding protein
MKMKKIFVLFIITILFAASLLPASLAAAEDDYVFRIAIYNDIAGLDPKVDYDPSTTYVTSQVVEPLLGYDENDQLAPLIASKWETKDNQAFVYTIRDDVKFSDGTPLTVDDVIFSLKRIWDPNEGAYMQWMYEPVESIEKTGDWEVTVKLKGPSNSWLYVLSTAAGFIVSKAYYEKHSDDFGTATGGVLGTGPYVFDHWTNGQEVVLKKNKNYWNGDLAGAPGSLVYKIIPDDTTRVAAIKAGDIDFAPQPPLELIDELLADRSLEVNNFASRNVTFVAFNTQRAPFNDVNLRKAVYHALDLKSFHENIIRKSGSIPTLLPQSEALYGNKPKEWRDYVEKAPTYEFNFEKAKEYLAKSGYPNGVSAQVIVNQNTRYNDIGLFVQESLRPLGIDIEIVKVTNEEQNRYYFGKVLDDDGHRDYDLLIGSWFADFADVGNILEPLFQSGTDSNTASYANADVDELIKQEIATIDESERNKTIFKALDIIIDEVPYVIVQYPNDQNVLNKRFNGPKLNTTTSMYFIQFKNIRLAGDK